jgi:hypothetical protein
MDILKELLNLKIELTPEELKDITCDIPTEDEKALYLGRIKAMGFRGFGDLTGISANAARFLYGFVQNGDIANIVSRISTAWNSYGIRKVICALYAIGFNWPEIARILFKMGFRNFTDNIVRHTIVRHRYELDKERLKFMELIDSAKQSVFQEIAAEVKATELATAKIYLKAIKAYQDKLDTLDPIIEPTGFSKYSRMIEDLQRKLNAMHGIDAMRVASVDVTAKIALARGLKEVEKEFNGNGSQASPTSGRLVEDDHEDSPFTLPVAGTIVPSRG